MPTKLRSRPAKMSPRESVSTAQLSLDSLAKKGLDALFILARVLTRSQLERAIRLVRSTKNYSRRDELLKRLNQYFAQRSKDPVSLERELRRSRVPLKRAMRRTLVQLLAQLSPNERIAILNRTLLRLQIQASEGTKSRKMQSAKSTPLTGRKAAKVGGGSLKKGAGGTGGRRPLLGRPVKKKNGGGGAGGGGGFASGLGDTGSWLAYPASPPTPASPPSSDIESNESLAPTFPPPKPKSSKKKPVLKVKRAKPVVSTGFAVPAQAAKPIKPTSPLKAGEKYYFWLQVGERVSGSIEIKDELLPTRNIPRQAILDVVLFSGEDGLTLVPGSDTAKLRLVDDVVTVASQPTEIPLSDVSDDPSLLEQRIFFPIVAPNETGNYRLRCNIYYQTVLVQSRIVNAYVMRRPQTQKKALQSKVDYTLSKTLSVSHVTGMQPHLLSVMLNSSGNGSHDFYFFGSKEFEKENISFNGLELQGLIDQARNAYALAAWGANNPWANQNYRYDQSRVQNLQQLKADLTRFAIRGYNIYDKVINRFAGGAQKAKELAKLMREPGMVQIALKESPSFILPAALIYDYSLDIDADSSKFTLCDAFTKAIEAAPPLEESDCFKGNCPTKDSDSIICPSGFWGYRHQLGLPLSVANAPDAPTTISWSKKPVVTVGVSTDPKFILREKHLENLQALRPAGLEWNYGSTRDEVIKKLKETKPQLVYFYCHGGVSETRPYIQVGTPNAAGNLSPSFLRAKKIRWDSPRPLVFINGCHTTALEPEQAIEFITPFIENANAAGVIGTEITIFEPLATAFSEDCLRRFLNKSPIGEAIRCARLKLLKDANPLGLVYIPYVMAGLSLVEQ